MTNFDEARRARDMALESAGSAERELEHVQEGIDYSLGQFKATFQELSYDLLGSDLVKGAVDIGNVLLSGLDAVIDKFGALSTVLGGVGIVAAIKNYSSLGTVVKRLSDAFYYGGSGGLATSITRIATQNPFAVAATGGLALVGVISAVVSAYNKYKAEQLKAAKQDASNWEENRTSIEGNIEQITQLREKLADSNTTESEAYEAKSKLLEIQDQLSSSYGNQVEGIDLVNGSLETQIELLNKVSQEQAKTDLRVNKDQYKDARKAVEEFGSSGDSRLLSDVTLKFDAQQQAALDTVLAKYTDKITKYQDDYGMVHIKFTGDATEAESVLMDFQDDLEAISKQEGLGDAFEPLYEGIANTVKSSREVLDEYGDLYDTWKKQQIYADTEQYGGKQAVEWLNDYTQAVKEYNDALASGDPTQIDAKAAAYGQLFAQMQQIPELAKYADQFTEIGDQLNKTLINQNNFTGALTGKYKTATAEYVKSMGDFLKEYELTDVNLKDMLVTDGMQEGEDVFRTLITLAQQYGFVTGETAEEVQPLIDVLANLGFISRDVSASVTDTIDSFTDSIDNMKESVGGAITVQDNLNAAMAASLTKTGLNAEQIENVTKAYQGLESYNPDTLFERTATGVRLNAEAMRELNRELQEQTLTNYKDQFRDLQLELGNARRNGLDSSDIENRIQMLSLLIDQYEGATSAYQEWLNAQSNGEAGDMYDSFQTALKRGDELLKDGLVGTNEFRAIADLFAYGDQSTATIEELVDAYNAATPQVRKFFTEGREGAEEFVNYLKSSNLMSPEGIFQGNTDDIAKALGIDVEGVEAIINKLHDYGFDIEIDTQNLDETRAKADQLYAAAERVQQAKQLLSQSPLTVDVEAGDAQAQLDSIVEELANMPQETLIDVGFTASNGETVTAEDIKAQIGTVDVPVNLTANGDVEGSVADESATVDYKKGEQEEPEDKDAKVNYGLGKQEEPHNATATVDYKLGSYPTSLPTLTQTVLVNRVDTGAKRYAGTFHAFANGTGNAFNRYRSYAKGKVALDRDETALVNELGTEGLIRGDTFSLIPGGMHFEKLKKGDIILNHRQIQALMKTGSAPGHGKAYANGTFKAYRGGTEVRIAGDFYRSGGSSASTASTKASTQATVANTKATTSNTSSKKKNTKASEKEAKTYDWVEVRLERLGRATENVAKTITDFVSKIFKKNQLTTQISKVTAQINANAKAYETYTKRANKVKFTAKEAKYRDLVMNGDMLIEDIKSEDLQKKIEDYQEWTNKALDCRDALQELRNTQLELYQDLVNIPTEYAQKKVDRLAKSYDNLKSHTDMSSGGGSKLAAYAKMQTWDYDGAVERLGTRQKDADAKRKSTYSDLQDARQITQGAESVYSTATDALKSAGSRLLKAKNTKAIQQAIQKGKPVSTKGLKGTALKLAKDYNSKLKQANSAYNDVKSARNAESKASATFENAKSASNAIRYSRDAVMVNSLKKEDSLRAQAGAGNPSYQYANSYLAAQTKNLNDQRYQYKLAFEESLINEKMAQDEYNASAKAVLKYSKNLTAAQRKAVENGEVIDATAVSNKNARKAVEAYNMSLQRYTIAQDAAAEATENFNNAEMAYVDGVIDNAQAGLDNIDAYFSRLIDWYQTEQDKLESIASNKTSIGEDLNREDYEGQLELIKNRREALQEEVKVQQKWLDDLVKAGTIKVDTEEWWEMQGAIDELATSANKADDEFRDLEDTMRNDLYIKPIDEAIEKLNDLSSALGNVNSMINDSMKYDDAGRFTDFGLANLAADVSEFNVAREELKKLVEERDEFLRQYRNADTDYSEKELEKDLRENSNKLSQATVDAYNKRSAVIQAITDQVREELKVTQDLISAESERFKKQKSYNEYDKKLRDQNKELQLTRQQIAAIEGITDAETNAARARLKAQEAEQQDALNETIQDHVYEMRVQGLEDLSSTLQDNFDKWSEDMNGNLQSLVDALNNATVVINDSMALNTQTVEKLYDSFGVRGVTMDTAGANLVPGEPVQIGDKTYVPLDSSQVFTSPTFTQGLPGVNTLGQQIADGTGETIKTILDASSSGSLGNNTYNIGSIIDVAGNLDSVTGRQVIDILKSQYPNIFSYISKEMNTTKIQQGH